MFGSYVGLGHDVYEILRGFAAHTAASTADSTQAKLIVFRMHEIIIVKFLFVCSSFK